MSNRFPKLVAFDLDYTLWPLWIDTHACAPLKREATALNRVIDVYGEVISFYHDVPEILHRLQDAEIKIAAASRSSAPKLAREALSLLLMPPSLAEPDEAPKAASEFFDQMEIYPKSKLVHFRKLHEKTELPYSEMLFFDDEHRNREVEKLGARSGVPVFSEKYMSPDPSQGVTFILVEDGMTEDVLEKGLSEWRRRHGHVNETADST